MKALFIAFALVQLLVIAGPAANAQATATPAAAAAQAGDSGITPNGAIGEVKVIDAAGHQLIIKTDAGSLVTVALNDATVYMRLAPGEKTLTNAAKIAFTDVGEGDRVWARGKVSDDHKAIPARALIVMNKADIAKKQEAERAEWKRRGLLGIITAVKPETKEITISSRTITGQQSIIIPVSDKVEMRRYAPDSIKFAEAKPAEFAELKVGDQLRALGERSADGSSFTPEKVVTGTFRNVAGTVVAVDAAAGEVKINDLQTKQLLTIVVKQDAVLRRFPSAAEMGGMMSMMGRGPGAQGPPGAAGAQPPAGQGGNRPPGGQGGSPQGGGPGGLGGGRMGGVNIQEMLERLPTIAIADVKVGDTIIVSSTKGADPTRLTAISVISGADTLLNMMAARQQAAGPATPNPSAGLGSGIQFGIGLP
jgi:preprotein translocase subunit YajC